MSNDGIRNLGMTLLQAFQKLPGFNDMFGNSQTLSTLQLLCGILTIVFLVVGVCLVIIGIVKFSIKKLENERNASRDSKSALNYLIGGTVGGAVLILLPSILLIVGSIFGSIAGS